MDSTIIQSNYSNKNYTLYGTHYATLTSDKVSYENNTGEFILSYITPNNADTAYEKISPKNSTSNVVNKDKLNVSKITTSNTVTLTIPKHFFYIENIDIVCNKTMSKYYGVMSCKPVTKITRHQFVKGQKFIITNIGGYTDSPEIIGVVE